MAIQIERVNKYLSDAYFLDLDETATLIEGMVDAGVMTEEEAASLTAKAQQLQGSVIQAMPGREHELKKRIRFVDHSNN
jgi:hypothetical protein